MCWGPLGSSQISLPPLKIARSEKFEFSHLLNESKWGSCWRGLWVRVAQETLVPCSISLGNEFCLHLVNCMGHLVVLPVVSPSLAESSLRKGPRSLAHLHVFFGPSKDSPGNNYSL